MDDVCNHAILLVIIQIVQLPTLFHIDAYLMFGFMILRSLKQIYKIDSKSLF